MVSSETRPYIVNGDGSVEWQCHRCAEPILIYKDDVMTIVVGEGGVVAGVLCELCARKPAEGAEA
jgi:hypothetical protein